MQRFQLAMLFPAFIYKRDEQDNDNYRDKNDQENNSIHALHFGE